MMFKVSETIFVEGIRLSHCSIFDFSVLFLFYWFAKGLAKVKCGVVDRSTKCDVFNMFKPFIYPLLTPI